MLEVWAVQNCITHNALRHLLCLLHKLHPNLPKDPRTLFSLSYEFTIDNIAGGQYYHFGIASTLSHQFQLKLYSKINLQLNIDGLPLFKSSGKQLWPILALIEENHKFEMHIQPFVIGVYAGDRKPSSAVDYLKQFVDEMKKLEEDGFELEGKKYIIQIKNIVCDAQARVFVKQVKSCAGYSGCDKCTQSGFHTGTKMIFPEVNAPLRTDDSFKHKQDEEHHIGVNPFEGLNLGMVSQFSIDYMHLVCLGVMRRLLNLLISGPLSVRIGRCKQMKISSVLTGLQKAIPAEFARKPRSLSELARWKATEFRQFLLYTGIVVLKNNVHESIYKNFLLLKVAIRILTNEKDCSSKNELAHTFLISFFQHFGQVYGRENLVYNVHGLVHLASDVKLFGPLDNFSSFPFENFLCRLKRYVRKPCCILQQIILRIQEQSKIELQLLESSSQKTKNTTYPYLKEEHFSGPVPISTLCKQYTRVVKRNFILTTRMPNNCIMVDDDIGLVQNILQTHAEISIVYRKFHNMSSFFDYPCHSSDIGVNKVSFIDLNLKIRPLSGAIQKMVLLPFHSDYFVAIPFLHGQC